MHHPPNEQVEAGKITAGALILARQLCMNPIIGTRLDQEISTYIQDHGGICALRGYAPPFTDLTYPKTICLSIGFEAVHGLPGPRIVEPDDLITVDLVVEVDGWFTDAARTFSHSPDPHLQNFISICSSIFQKSTNLIKAGLPLSQYGHYVETLTRSVGYQIIDEFAGHGINKKIHDSPQIPNTSSNIVDRFQVGQSVAIEPIIAELPYQLRLDDDGWTYRANCLTAHFEDTIWVGEKSIIRLTEVKTPSVL